MLEFDVYLPRYYNDGSLIEAEKTSHITEKLVREFGDATSINEVSGAWIRPEGKRMVDRIVIIRILTFDKPHEECRAFMEILRHDMEVNLKQGMVLITEREVRVVP